MHLITLTFDVQLFFADMFKAIVFFALGYAAATIQWSNIVKQPFLDALRLALGHRQQTTAPPVQKDEDDDEF